MFWTTLWWLMFVVYLVSCLGLILIVLMQKGKGSGFAGAFGIGPGSETVFGPRMSRSLPVKMTYIMAGCFLVLAMLMTIVSGRIKGGIAPDKVEVTEEMAAAQANQEKIDSGLDALGVGQAEVPEDEESDATGAEDDGSADAPAPADAAETGTEEAPAPAEGN
ncbi:MAG: preprotein translocase subunit SecG [bacterium]|nr:preprotein translocase subunit SecG [bacterium]